MSPTTKPIPAVLRARAALAAGLALLALARVGLPWLPGSWAWSLDVLRHLSPVAAWLPWALAAAVLAHAWWRRAAWPARAGDWIARHPWAPAVAALALAALVLALPDDTHMTGDFILRRRAIDEARDPASVFPQSLPLDVWLHYTVPRWLFTQMGLLALDEARLWGALDAAAIGWLAVAFARAFAFEGAAALAATAGVAFGGWLALFTGYGKGLAELVVLVLAIAAWGADVAGRDRAHLRLGIATALAVAIHRAGMLLIPAAWIAGGLALVRYGPSPRRVLGMALPLAALAIVAAHAFAIARGYDVEHHLAAVADPLRAWDLANVIQLSAPLALCLPLLAIGFGVGIPRRREALPLVALAVTLAALAVAVHPQQGVVRDWDVFAPSAMALAALTAWLAGEALRETPAVAPPPRARSDRRAPARGAASDPRSRAGALALAAALACAVPAIQWLLHLHDVRHGMARIEAIAAGPPERSSLERARLWDYLGVRDAWLDDWAGSARAFRQSAALLPTPRVLDQWGRAELRVGNWEGARQVYRTMIARQPDSPTGWRGLATAVTRMDDRDSARVAVEGLLRLVPNDREARALLDFLDQERAR